MVCGMRTLLLAVLVALSLIACAGESSDPPRADARPGAADARSGGAADAAPGGTPDAAAGTPDAAP